MSESTPKVYAAIAAVMADLAKIGIAKNDTNTFDKYKFRGIDAVYNTLAPLLSKHGLLILPRITEREVHERTNAKGTALFYVSVRAEFDFVAAEDGSQHTVTAFGEAMDRGDKGTNKAMTAAYKYACFEAFCIPVDGSDDADAESHEVEAFADWRAKLDECDSMESLHETWKTMPADARKALANIKDAAKERIAA